jgi:hypothetical protein
MGGDTTGCLYGVNGLAPVHAHRLPHHDFRNDNFSASEIHNFNQSTKCGWKIDQPQLLSSYRMDIGRGARAPAAAPYFLRWRTRGRCCGCLGVLCATRGTSRVQERCDNEAVPPRQQNGFTSSHCSSTLDSKHNRPIICLHHQHGIQALIEYRLKMAKPPAMPSQPNTSFSMEFEPVNR